MPKTYSLQRRLGAGLALGVVALWSVATFVSTQVVRHELDEIHQLALEQAARRVLAFAEYAGRSDSQQSTGQQSDSTSSLSFVVKDKDGNIVLDDSKLNVSAADRSIAQQSASEHSNVSYEVHDPISGLSVEVTDRLDYRRQALRESVTALIAPLPLLIPLSLALVWLIVQRSLGTVERLRRRIESRDENDLNPLPENGVPTELKPMVTAVNALMSRLDRAIHAERDFASNSAHELRTPIAAALAKTQRLIATLPSGDAHLRAREVEKTLLALASLSAKLMQLARAESGLLVKADVIDQSDVLPHILADTTSSEHDADRLQFRIEGSGQFLTRLDPDGLGILLRNLIENALKHGPPDSPVEVVLDGARNEIRVRNEGSVVSPEAMEQARQRFVRGASSARGAGLGLSIIDAITKHSGVDVRFVSPASRRIDGFEAVVSSSSAA